MSFFLLPFRSRLFILLFLRERKETTKKLLSSFTLYSKPFVTPLIMFETCEVVVRMAASSLRVPKDFSTRRSWRRVVERWRWRWR